MNFERPFLLVLWVLVLWVFPMMRAWPQKTGTTEFILADDERMLEILMELLPEEQLEELDLSDVMEQLNDLRRHPMDLNSVTADELGRLRFLSPLLIRQILNYRQRTGGFISINELQVIEGMDLRTAQFLSQFFLVRNKSQLETITYNEVKNKGKQEWILRYGRILENQQGYLVRDTGRSRYLGSPDRLLLRYRYDLLPDLRIGINMEKDPGEQFFSGAQRYGFDFYSGNIQLRNQRYFSNMVIGDYVLQFGQGLSMWAGYATGKGAILHGIARQGAGIRPHTTANEIDFLRGVATSFEHRFWRVTPFFSYRKRDGKLEQYEEGGQVWVASLGQSGLHRTPGETDSRRQVGQWAYGVNVERQHPLWRIGTTVYRSTLTAALVPPDLLRNQYVFRGNDLIHSSIYYQVSFRNAYFFGESAMSGNGGVALLNGALLSLHHHVSLGILHRYYQRDHFSFFAQAFGAGSTVANEKGVYVGLQYQPNRKFSFLAYVDQASFPWAKYRVDGPSGSIDLLSQMSYAWNRRTHLTGRYRYRRKQLNMDSGLPEYRLGMIENQQFRISFESRMGLRWRIRNRVEAVTYAAENMLRQTGWMCYQDVFYQPAGAKLTGNLRIAYFHTDSYDTRIYAFENDVLYASSFPAYHNKGIRYYLNLRWNISRSLDLWGRYALIRYAGLENIGSGLDQIPEGNKRSEVKVQLRFKIL